MKLKIYKYAKYIFLLSALSFTASCTDDGFNEFEAPQGNVNGIAPNTIFTTANVEGEVDYSFRSFSTDAITYLWDFGNGETSTEANPDYTYPAGGLFSVILETTSSDGLVATDSTQVAPIIAGFEIALIRDSEVTFLNTTTGGASYLWDFGDGETSEEENPVHTYTSDADFDVTLTATSNVTDDFSTDEIESIEGVDVTVTNTVEGLVLSTIPDFTFVANGAEVTFTDASLLAVAGSHSWDFGDGVGTSSDLDPVYTYAVEGVYEVTLTTTNSENVSRSVTKSVNASSLPLDNTQFGFIVDTTTDTGELRLDLGSAGVLAQGMISVNVSKSDSGADAFVALYGASTTGTKAMIDMRLGQGDGENFSFRNETLTEGNEPEFVPNQTYNVVITWDATAAIPLLTVAIDDQLLTAAPFASGGNLSDIMDGVRNIQFRFGGGTAITSATEGFSIDDLGIFDTSSGTPVSVFVEDFESYNVGDSLDPNDANVGAIIPADLPYHVNSTEITVRAY